MMYKPFPWDNYINKMPMMKKIFPEIPQIPSYDEFCNK